MLLVLSSCGEKSALTQNYLTLDSTRVRLDSILPSQAAVALFFLSPECPLCQNYSVTIAQLQEDYISEDISFFGIVSGEYYSDSEIKGFLIKYKLDLPVILDPHLNLADHFDATITPEVLLVGKSGETLYQGAIDNWAISLGQKRPKITEHYFANALNAYLAEEEISPKKTEAIGCFIE